MIYKKKMIKIDYICPYPHMYTYPYLCLLKRIQSRFDHLGSKTDTASIMITPGLGREINVMPLRN